MQSLASNATRRCLAEVGCSFWSARLLTLRFESDTSNERPQPPKDAGSSSKTPSISIAKFSKMQGKKKLHLPLSIEGHLRRAKAGKMIGPVRAMYEYCLTQEDLADIRKRKVRSSYHGEPPETHFLESDVYQKAIHMHGSEAALAKAIRNRKTIDPSANIRDRLSKMSKQRKPFVSPFRQKPKVFVYLYVPRDTFTLLSSGSGRVVSFAICVNGVNCVIKLIAWLATGSHSIFAEVVHSAADTVNQIVLAVGIIHAEKTPDSHHPYGYANVRYVSSLVSGVGIFFFGTGLSFYHGFSGLINPAPLEPVTWALSLFALSLISEGGTLILAVREMRKKAAEEKSDIWTYLREAEDPSLSVVFYEDCAAVLGVSIASVCVATSVLLHSSIPDTIGSLAIGCVLGFVASRIIAQSARHLIGRSIPRREVDTYVEELENDDVVRSVHDVKATELGAGEVRLKAEIDFHGRNVAQKYLEKRENLSELLAEIQCMTSEDELREFLLQYGEEVIDQLGEEVDRIEAEIKRKHKQIRHMDLESL